MPQTYTCTHKCTDMWGHSQTSPPQLLILSRLSSIRPTDQPGSPLPLSTKASFYDTIHDSIHSGFDTFNHPNLCPAASELTMAAPPTISAEVGQISQGRRCCSSTA